MCVLAVSDEWSQEQSAEFKSIVEQVTKVKLKKIFKNLNLKIFTVQSQPDIEQGGGGMVGDETGRQLE